MCRSVLVTPLTMEEGHQVVHHLTTTEVEVVDTTTTRDTSLNSSLGEYFSPFSFVVLYHFYLVMF